LENAGFEPCDVLSKAEGGYPHSSDHQEWHYPTVVEAG
jgi:hypothetical protein